MSNVRRLLGREMEARITAEKDLPRKRAEAIARRTNTADLLRDMEGAGEEGLYWAAERYSPAGGVPFHAFAQVIVDRSIFRFLRSELRHRKLSAAGYAAVRRGSAQVSPGSEDSVDPLSDTDEAALSKLHRYVDAKVMAGAVALGMEIEQRQAEDPERAAAFRRLTGIVRGALADLGPRNADLFSAIYGEGKSVEEVAEETGTPAVTLRSRHRRSLLELRKALEERGAAWQGD